MDTKIDVTFNLGQGQLTIILSRGGKQLSKQKVSQTGSITFEDTQVGDGISIDGICTGTAKVHIHSTNTISKTPIEYPEGNILDDFELI
jgi:hypothetical protein